MCRHTHKWGHTHTHTGTHAHKHTVHMVPFELRKQKCTGTGSGARDREKKDNYSIMAFHISFNLHDNKIPSFSFEREFYLQYQKNIDHYNMLFFFFMNMKYIHKNHIHHMIYIMLTQTFMNKAPPKTNKQKNRHPNSKI